LFRVFGWREIHAVFLANFVLGKSQHRTERRVHEQGLSIGIFYNNSDGTYLEGVVEKRLRVAFSFHSGSSNADFNTGDPDFSGKSSFYTGTRPKMLIRSENPLQMI